MTLCIFEKILKECMIQNNIKSILNYNFVIPYARKLQINISVDEPLYIMDILIGNNIIDIIQNLVEQYLPITLDTEICIEICQRN